MIPGWRRQKIGDGSFGYFGVDISIWQNGILLIENELYFYFAAHIK
jgi:hypothetical protein